MAAGENYVYISGAPLGYQRGEGVTFTVPEGGHQEVPFKLNGPRKRPGLSGQPIAESQTKPPASNSTNPPASPLDQFQAALQKAVDSKDKAALLALFNMEGVDAKTQAEDKAALDPVIDKIFSWPGVKVECRHRPESKPALAERDGKKFTLNGQWTFGVSLNNTAPSLSKSQGYVFPAGQTPNGMRILMQVEANQPVAEAALKAAQVDSDAMRGLFEIHGVANAAGPTTKDYPLPTRGGNTETVHLEPAVLLDYTALRSVTVGHDQNGYSLRLTLTDDGKQRFADITARHLDKRIGIVIDGKLLSAPVVKEPILGGVLMVTGNGNLTEQEANDLASKLRTPDPSWMRLWTGDDQGSNPATAR